MTEPITTLPPPTIPGDHDIELVSGDYLNLLDPDPAAITLDVIAHGLSNTCRYAGQARRFYSVAEHACYVATKLAIDGHQLDVQLAGLHHDDHEAFVADVARPLKSLLQPAYDDLSDRLDHAIAIALDIPLLTTMGWAATAIEETDHWALAAEVHHLMPSRGRGWWCDGLYDPDERPAPTRPIGLVPALAYRRFVGMHDAIAAQIEALRQ